MGDKREMREVGSQKQEIRYKKGWIPARPMAGGRQAVWWTRKKDPISIPFGTDHFFSLRCIAMSFFIFCFVLPASHSVNPC